jgi:two-component system sensor histidine kinase UhpB
MTSLPDPALHLGSGPRQHDEALVPMALRARLGSFGRRRVLAILDLGGLVVIGAAFAQVGPPELLFHVVFVLLTIEAFTFGRRVTLQRIAICSIGLVGYAALPFVGLDATPLELTEWPLMFTIAVLVAWMADREQTAARRYAGLYRQARERLETAQEEERRRLAQDLHDGIGQTLTAVSLTLDVACALDDPGALRRHAEHARHLVGVALGEARSAAERVRPPRLEARGLASALTELVAHAGVPIELALDPRADVRLEPPSSELELFRIAQEAIANAARHAPAAHLRLALTRTRRGLELVVLDDGIGFESTDVDSRGLGLAGMRERAGAIGAELKLSTSRGRGTRVRVVVPARNVVRTRAARPSGPPPTTEGTP